MTLTTSLFLEVTYTTPSQVSSFSLKQPTTIHHGVYDAEAKEAFNHVLDTVLDRGDSSPLKRSLINDGITDIFDLITIVYE